MASLKIFLRGTYIVTACEGPCILLHDVNLNMLSISYDAWSEVTSMVTCVMMTHYSAPTQPLSKRKCHYN